MFCILNLKEGFVMADLRGGSTVAGYIIWHAGNQGSGSGMDADSLDTFHLDDILCQIWMSLF
jgi:hypothetical protein